MSKIMDSSKTVAKQNLVRGLALAVILYVICYVVFDLLFHFRAGSPSQLALFVSSIVVLLTVLISILSWYFVKLRLSNLALELKYYRQRKILTALSSKEVLAKLTSLGFVEISLEIG